MKFCRLYLILALSLLMESCNNGPIERLIPRESLLPIDARPVDTLLRFLSFNTVNQAFVVEDSIVALSNSYVSGSPVLEILSLTDESYLRKFFTYGPGKDSVMSSIATVNGHDVLLYDFVKKHLMVIDCSEAIKGRGRQSYSYMTNLVSQRIIPISHNFVLWLNPDSFYGKRRIYRSNPVHIKSFFHKSPAINVALGFLQYNEKNKKVLYVNSVESKIEILDKHSCPLVRIDGPGGENASYYCDSDGFYSFLNEVPSSYSCTSSNDNRIIAVYCPSSNRSNGTITAETSTLLVFDWDGVLLSSYSVPSRVISISLSSSSDFCFCFEEDSTGERHLIQYAI